jgi:hypothetical protein
MERAIGCENAIGKLMAQTADASLALRRLQHQLLLIEVRRRSANVVKPATLPMSS